MALPQFIGAVKKQGHWQLNWVKLISIGLSAFYVTILPWASFASMGKYLTLFPLTMHAVHPVPHTVGGVVFGYLLLSLSGKVDQK